MATRRNLASVVTGGRQLGHSRMQAGAYHDRMLSRRRRGVSLTVAVAVVLVAAALLVLIVALCATGA